MCVHSCTGWKGSTHRGAPWLGWMPHEASSQICPGILLRLKGRTAFACACVCLFVFVCLFLFVFVCFCLCLCLFVFVFVFSLCFYGTLALAPTHWLHMNARMCVESIASAVLWLRVQYCCWDLPNIPRVQQLHHPCDGIRKVPQAPTTAHVHT